MFFFLFIAGLHNIGNIYSMLIKTTLIDRYEIDTPTLHQIL